MPVGPTVPAITVLMPMYNAEAFVEEAVRSIQAQSFTDWILLAMDDGSSDGTLQCVADLGRDDGRIQVLALQHAGYVAALQIGLDQTSSPLVARMDADDISLPQRFARQVEYLETHPNVAAVGGQYQPFLDNGDDLPQPKLPVTPAALRASAETYCPLAHPTVMFRREAVAAIGGYRRALYPAEDYDLWLRLLDRHELANLEDEVLRYRVHTRQVSQFHLIRQAMATVIAQELSRRRRAGIVDALPPDFEPNQAALESLGISGGAVNEQVLAAFLHRWNTYQHSGYLQEADGIERALSAWALSVRRRAYAASRLSLERAHWHWNDGRYLHCGSALLSALLAHPTSARRAAAAVTRKCTGWFTGR